MRLRCFTQGCSNRVPLTPITRPFRDSSECRNRYVCGPNQGAHYADRHSGYEQKSRQHCYSTAGEIFILPPDIDRYPAASPENDYGCFSIRLQFDATRRRALLSKGPRGRARKRWNAGTRKKMGPIGLARWAKHCPTTWNSRFRYPAGHTPRSDAGCRPRPLPAINPLERQRQMQ